DVKFFQGLSFVIGDTQEEAQSKWEEYREYSSLDGYLAHAAIVDKDGRTYPPETLLSQVETNTAKGFLDAAAALVTDREPVVADLASRARGDHTVIVGTPEHIADELERWQAAGVDGINVINWVIPGSFEEFAEKVIPVLQARGLAQSEYTPGSLRRKPFGDDRLNQRHPAARYRGAFGEETLVGGRARDTVTV